MSTPPAKAAPGTPPGRPAAPGCRCTGRAARAAAVPPDPSMPSPSITYGLAAASATADARRARTHSSSIAWTSAAERRWPAVRAHQALSSAGDARVGWVRPATSGTRVVDRTSSPMCFVPGDGETVFSAPDDKPNRSRRPPATARQPRARIRAAPCWSIGTTTTGQQERVVDPPGRLAVRGRPADYRRARRRPRAARRQVSGSTPTGRPRWRRPRPGNRQRGGARLVRRALTGAPIDPSAVLSGRELNSVAERIDRRRSGGPLRSAADGALRQPDDEGAPGTATVGQHQRPS